MTITDNALDAKARAAFESAPKTVQSGLPWWGWAREVALRFYKLGYRAAEQKPEKGK